MSRKPYPSDVNDDEWTLLEPLIPSAKSGGRPRTTDVREVVNAVFYVLRGGIQWRMMPHDFPRIRQSMITSRIGARRAFGKG